MAPLGAATGASDESVTPTDLAEISNLDSEASIDANEHSSVNLERPSLDEVEIDDAVQDADGEIEVVVRVDELEEPLAAAQSDEDVVAALQAHAETSQEPLLDYAAATDGVEVENTFWITNAVLLTVDTDLVDVDELAVQSGVTEIHENFEVESPAPAGDDENESLATPIGTEDGQAEPDQVFDGNYNTTYGLDQINATDVWEEYDTRGDGVSVAVLDSGVDVTHEDLELYTEDEHDPTYPGGWAELDENGELVEGSEPHATTNHGTHVSGTVAGGDGLGYHIGVAPDTNLMNGLVLPGGSGSFAQIIGGIEWAVDEDADVINLSLGAEGYHEGLIDPVRNAHDAGVVVATSSGNDGSGTSGSPGNVYEAFSIGASNEDENIASFSSGEEIDTGADWGNDAPDDWPDEYVVPDISAPGEDVHSTIPGDSWGELSGTSMAAPHVSGALALMMSSAAGVDAATAESALEETAWKPSGHSDDKDTRYGYGIIDVKAATDEVAPDGGVEGTVTDEDGEPVEGATVTVDTVSDTTDENGEYSIAAHDGEYAVVADEWGYAPAEETVTVSDGEYTEQNLSLELGANAELEDPQPGAVETGDSFEVQIDVASMESATVDLAGDYEGDFDLEVNDNDHEFGEPYEWSSPQTGTLPITVHANDGAEGEIELEHTIDGFGHSVGVSSGSTHVVDSFTDVAIVDVPDGEDTEDVKELFDDATAPYYQYEIVTTDDVMDAVENDEYRTYVVQSFGADDRDPDLVEEFVDATSSESIGVVLLDQQDDSSNAIWDQAAVTGDPVNAGATSVEADNPVYYVAENDHPIIDGVVEEGDHVEIYNPGSGGFLGLFGGWHSYFEEYSGHEDAVTIADVAVRDPTDPEEISGAGLAADEFSSTVLASSLGVGGEVEARHFNQDAHQILSNAMDFVSVSPPVDLRDEQPERIAPGETVNKTLELDDIEQVQVELADESTIDEDDLSLYLDGSINAFGEWRSYETPRNGEYEIAVAVDEDAVGTVALDSTFRTADGEDVELPTTGPTAVYDRPLEVPADVDTIEEGLDLIVEGDELVVADGEYEETVTVETDDITITGEEGATVVSNDTAVTIGADGTSLSGLYADGVAIEGAADVSIADLEAAGVSISDAASVSVSDVDAVDAATGVAVSDSTDVDVTDVETDDVNTGILVEESESVDVTNASVSAGDDGIAVDGSGGVTVADNTVSDATTGISVSDSTVETVSMNTVSETMTGIAISDSTVETVSDNEIIDSTDGLSVAGSATSLEATMNAIAADIGVTVDDVSSEDVSLEYNDLESTDVAIENVGDEPFDARLNWFGDDGPAANNGVEGQVVYDTFLTAPPEDVDTEKTTQIATDLHFEAGEVYTLGVPGATEQSIGDVFDDEFEGTVYGFDTADNSWEELRTNDAVGSLEAMLVVADSDGHAVLDFQHEGYAVPGSQDLEHGWNLVASPEYATEDEAFVEGDHQADEWWAAYEHPTGHLGEQVTHDADTNAFGGYFVFIPSEGDEYTLSAALQQDTDPTMDELYSDLGLDTESIDAENDSVASIAGGSVPAISA